MANDYAKYKPLLLEYLRIATGTNYIPGRNYSCISPQHEDPTPSMRIDADHVHCFGCGFDGDIYDVCGLLTGETDKGEQYKLIQSAFGDTPFISAPQKAKPLAFVPDPAAIDAVCDHLRDIRGNYSNELAAFAHARGFDDPSYALRFAWWPGLRDCGIEQSILEAAGVDVPAWKHSGAVVRVGVGFKLHYIDADGKTIKRESRGGHTFPFPELPESDTAIFVEGELDAVSCRYAGIDAVAIGGTNGLSLSDAKKLLPYDTIILGFDNDIAGQEAMGIIEPRQKNYKSVPTILRTAGYKGEIKHFDWAGNPDAVDEKDVDDLVKHDKVYVLRHLVENAKEVPGGRADSNDPGMGSDGDGASMANRTGKANDNPRDTKSVQGKQSARSVSVAPPANRGGNDTATGRSGIAPDTVPFQFLGFDAEHYWIIPRRQNLPLSISRGQSQIKNWLFEIAPREWWGIYFTATNADGEEYLDTSSAIEWFRREEQARGMYNPDLIFGTGAHIDDGHAIVNTGRSIVCPDGTVSTYEEYRGKNIYSRSRLELKVSATPWTREDGAFFFQQLKTFGFEQELSYYVVAGFCAIAPFASCLFRRPHIWITAKKGTGKSFLLKDLIYPLLGDGYAFYREGLTTEASVRQNLKKDNRPIILDEFEVTRKSDIEIIKGVMSLARSSYSGEYISKGTSNQSGITFATRMMFCFASINVNIQEDSDRSRIAVCRMTDSVGRMQSLNNPDGLRSRIFLRLDEMLTNIRAAQDLIESWGYDKRTADTYAPFFAGFWMIMSDNPFGVVENITEEKIIERLKVSAEQIAITSEKAPDEDRILERILQERIRTDDGPGRTIAEMLTIKNDALELIYAKEVQGFGVRRYKPCKDIPFETLAIAADHKYICDTIMKNTSFESTYKEVLRRHYAYLQNKLVNIGGTNTTCMMFRWSDIEAKYFVKEQDSIPF